MIDRSSAPTLTTTTAPPPVALASMARRQARARRRREAQLASWARAVLRGPGGPPRPA